MNLRLRITAIISALLFSSEVIAYEYVILKRVHEDLNIKVLPYKYTVWHIDALNLVKYNIEAKGALIDDPKDRQEFMEAEVKKISMSSLGGLAMMGMAAVAKMELYGLTTTPAAVLLDEDGSVVHRWNGIEDGLELFSGMGVNK